MTLREVHERINLKKVTNKKLEELYKEKEELESEVEKLEKSMIREQKDVDRMENGSLSSAIYGILGKKEEKIEKERKEAYTAKAKYEEAVQRLGIIKADVACYEKQAAELEHVEEDYQKALNAKIVELKNTDSTLSDTYEEMITCHKVQVECKQAIKKGENARRKAVEVKERLETACKYAKLDIITDIFDSSKYDSLENMDILYGNLQKAVEEFQKELKDMENHKKLDSPIGEMLKEFNYWADDIFTDIIMTIKLGNSLKDVKRLVASIEHALEQLNVLSDSEMQYEQDLKDKMEKIVHLYK